MTEVAPLLVPLGSPRGGHLVDKHDARIIFSPHAIHSVSRHTPHDTPRDAPRDMDLGIYRGLARGVRRDGPRDHHRVDSCVDPRDVPRRLPKTHACTKHDGAAKPTPYRATNSSDSERAQKSDLDCTLTVYHGMFNIDVLTPVGNALFPSCRSTR